MIRRDRSTPQAPPTKPPTPPPPPEAGMVRIPGVNGRPGGWGYPCPDDQLECEQEFNAVTADQICRKAAGLVVGTRAEQHGDWNVVFTRIAALWSAFLGVPISAKQAALMMVQFKTIRADTGNYNPDDFVDIAGYGGGAGEVAARVAQIMAEAGK